jgi:hypothetical protein
LSDTRLALSSSRYGPPVQIRQAVVRRAMRFSVIIPASENFCWLLSRGPVRNST